MNSKLGPLSNEVWKQLKYSCCGTCRTWKGVADADFSRWPFHYLKLGICQYSWIMIRNRSKTLRSSTKCWITAAFLVELDVYLFHFLISLAKEDYRGGMKVASGIHFEPSSQWPLITLIISCINLMSNIYLKSWLCLDMNVVSLQVVRICLWKSTSTRVIIFTWGCLLAIFKL